LRRKQALDTLGNIEGQIFFRNVAGYGARIGPTVTWIEDHECEGFGSFVMLHRMENRLGRPQQEHDKRRAHQRQTEPCNEAFKPVAKPQSHRPPEISAALSSFCSSTRYCTAERTPRCSTAASIAPSPSRCWRWWRSSSRAGTPSGSSTIFWPSIQLSKAR